MEKEHITMVTYQPLKINMKQVFFIDDPDQLLAKKVLFIE